MKLAAVVVVVLMLLFYFEPIMGQGKWMKVLRMCKSRFTKCQSQKRFKRDYRGGAKCCGRAWTVCQLHRFPCIKICYNHYRGCMCVMGFSFYC